MKEFWKKHKVAIMVSGGILVILYLYYQYEQAQAQAAATNNANAADEASQLATESLPLLYGGGSTGLSSTGSLGSTVPLNNYVDPSTGTTTASQIPNTSSSGVPTTSANNQATNSQSPTISLPTVGVSPSAYATGTTGATPFQGTAAQATAQAMAAIQNAPCQYPINGQLSATGIPACGPNGYQFSGVNGPGSINPEVDQFLPGQPGYAAAVQAQLATTEQQNPGDIQDIQNYETLLQEYGGTSENSSTPAGATQTAAPVSSIPRGSIIANPVTIGNRFGSTQTPTVYTPPLRGGQTVNTTTSPKTPITTQSTNPNAVNPLPARPTVVR